MAYSDQSNNLRVEIDTHECEIDERTRDRMIDALGTLAKQVEAFPISDVRIVVEQTSHDNQYVVKTTLILPNATFTNREHGGDIYATFENCLHAVREDVEAYKHRLDDEEDRHKHLLGTRQDVAPSHEPDAAAIESAVEAGDYAAFREATFPYEEALRKRAGRWVERYPEFEAKIDKTVKMADVVEGVFLRAFEEYPNRPVEVRFGEWLAGFIDPTVKAFEHDADEELRNIEMARTASEAGQ